METFEARAIVAHDIRNPLQCIQGYAALLARGVAGAGGGA